MEYYRGITMKGVDLHKAIHRDFKNTIGREDNTSEKNRKFHLFKVPKHVKFNLRDLGIPILVGKI